jgi:hypothetical protein
MSEAPINITFGKPEEWQDFARRNQHFLTIWPDFANLIDAVFARRFMTQDPLPRVVYTLGRLAVEDAMEILLNAGNGYGVAGLKLLRSLFERLVTMIYLIQHPEEVENFLDFHWVHLRKTLNHLKTAGGDPLKYYDAKELEEIDSRYQAIRHRYERTCPECGQSLGLPSWTKRDLATLAKEVGLGPAYLTLAYGPTLQVHTTTFSMTSRLEETAEAVSFKGGPQRKEADQAVLAAHTCLTILLEQGIRFFRLPIDVQTIRDLYRRAWPNERLDR